MAKIKYVVGDATAPEGDGQKVIVHICNDIGAWGAGFTGALSKKYTLPEASYRSLTQYPLGMVDFVRVTDHLVVANLIGQHNIANGKDNTPPIRYWAVNDGLEEVAEFCLGEPHWKTTVHMPRIGCGLAGGKWDLIESLIEEILIGSNIDVTVYTLPNEVALYGLQG